MTDKTALTLTTLGREYTVSIDKWDLDLYNMRDELLIPLLLAVGYGQDNVEKLFFDSEE